MSCSRFLSILIPLILLTAALPARATQQNRPPNVVLIYADDLGYGDVSCYGATNVQTPHIDKLAAQGVKFTDAHSPAATCTPSRYALLTGEYAWRRKGTNILRGNAAMIIEPGRFTLPLLFQKEGYATGVVGKWHLGLAEGGNKINWNGVIKPGPLEIGFDYAFIIPATGDRVPTVYIENHHIVGLDPDDPIRVSYKHPVGDGPTGKKHPELLKMGLNFGHAGTIVNGISRIGFQAGGKSAWWEDKKMSDTLSDHAVHFIERHRNEPFFLYFATHAIHVPRVTAPRFAGESGMGPRGDAILELDWMVGRVMQALDRLGLEKNTIVIFTSDNGPVLNDGYKDKAVQMLNGHDPSGPLRGTKYTVYEGGTRVPFIIRWPGVIEPGVSDALICQIDFLASFADLLNHPLPSDAAPDSVNVLKALMGMPQQGRQVLVEQGHGGRLALRVGHWKYIPPGRRWQRGKAPAELYNLARDINESNNLAREYPKRLKQMRARLKQIRRQGGGK